MAVKKSKDSFVIYDSVLKAAESLNGDDFKECILKIRDYALYGEDKDSENALIHTILLIAKPNLKAAAERYLRCVENGKLGKGYGSSGGRPKKGETKEEYVKRKGLEKTPRKPLTVNDNENGTVNDTVNVNEKDYDNENLTVNDNAPTGGTLKVPSSSIISLSSFSSNNSKITERDTKGEESSEAGSSGSTTSASNETKQYINEAKDPDISNKEELIMWIRASLRAMAEHTLEIQRLPDYNEILNTAIQCTVRLTGVDRAKAAEAVNIGIKNYIRGIQASRERQDEIPF